MIFCAISKEQTVSLSCKTFPINQVVGMKTAVWRKKCLVFERKLERIVKIIDDTMICMILKELEMLMLNPSVRKKLYGKAILGDVEWPYLTQTLQFSFQLRTDHQTMLTEIVKILVELNIIPVLLIFSMGQCKTKASCAIISIVKFQPKHRWFSVDNFLQNISFFISLELHYTWDILAEFFAQRVNWPFCNMRIKLKGKKSLWKCDVTHSIKCLDSLKVVSCAEEYV